MATPLSCPYCNSQFAATSLTANRRAICPRCGEAVAVPDDGQFALSSRTEEPPPRLPPAVQPKRHRDRRWLWPASIAIALAIGALAFLLAPRQTNSPPLANPPVATPTPTPPAQLDALKYLPAQANLVFAVQPAALMHQLRLTSLDPEAFFQDLGLPPSLLEGVGRTGLAWDDIDHLVIGWVVDDQVAEFRFLAGLALRQPLKDEERFRNALQARRVALPDREAYQVTLAGWPGVWAWPAEPTCWVFAHREADLPASNSSPGSPGPISATLSAIIHDRLTPGDLAWLVMDESDWARKPLLKLLGLMERKPPLVSFLEPVRSLAAGLSVTPSPRLRVYAALGHASSAKQWCQTLGDRARRGDKEADVLLEIPLDGPGAIGNTLRLIDNKLER